MLKPFFIVIFIAVGLNFLISGRLKAFYEKPELTIYPVKCVLSNCFISSMKCFANTNCRKTLGKNLKTTLAPSAWLGVLSEREQ